MVEIQAHQHGRRVDAGIHALLAADAEAQHALVVADVAGIDLDHQQLRAALAIGLQIGHVEQAGQDALGGFVDVHGELGELAQAAAAGAQLAHLGLEDLVSGEALAAVETDAERAQHGTFPGGRERQQVGFLAVASGGLPGLGGEGITTGGVLAAHELAGLQALAGGHGRADTECPHRSNAVGAPGQQGRTQGVNGPGG